MRSRVSIIGIRRRGNFRLADRDQNRAIPNTRPKNSDSRTNWLDYFPGRIATDKEGRFRIEALVPDYEFRLSLRKGALLFEGSTLRSGETKNLGDLKFTADEE
jgi:hypothetical protein